MNQESMTQKASQDVSGLDLRTSWRVTGYTGQCSKEKYSKYIPRRVQREWDSDWKKYAIQSRVWYQFTFNVREGYSLLLDMEGMD